MGFSARRGGQGLAVIACLAAAAFYSKLAFFNRPAPLPFDWAGFNPMLVVMLGLQVAGVVAALAGHAKEMYVLFACMFLPAGWYTLGLPSVYSWIGVANLAFLAGALVVGFSQPRREPETRA